MDVHELILSGEAEPLCPTFVLTANKLQLVPKWVTTDECLVWDPAIKMYRVERLYHAKDTYDKPRFSLVKFGWKPIYRKWLC